MGGIPPTTGAPAPADEPPACGFAGPPPPDGRGASPPAPLTRLVPPVLAGGRATRPLPAVAGGAGRGPARRAPLGGATLAPPVPLTPDGGLGIADATGLPPVVVDAAADVDAVAADLVALVVVAGVVGCAMISPYQSFTRSLRCQNCLITSSPSSRPCERDWRRPVRPSPPRPRRPPVSPPPPPPARPRPLLPLPPSMLH